MGWRTFGYFFCLTSAFNFVVCQVLTACLRDETQYVNIDPTRVPTARASCIACGVLHFIAMVISIAYLRGYIKYNPFNSTIRYLRSAAGLSPVTGSMRYRKITENGTSMPECSEDVETDSESE
ncbi:putative integral membrane protein [Babesia bovis T2Bo]|uniref:Membrane protein, putative n=1 Tax=Babesia bovis TaxID=5865 RepID=A7ANU8_BABBO|nr:putative integral membrane protein [Babesia bovis T2Bo]EDO08232.1 putative integral membrane protein [Babesia bovis T2Bo]|eukprot:XP_001611800.1 membrane protein [Babesia bovis T2Bo]